MRTRTKLFTPAVMHNENNYIISLGRFCKWLSDQRQESMGVRIYPGFTASKILMMTQRVFGIKTE